MMIQSRVPCRCLRILRRAVLVIFGIALMLIYNGLIVNRNRVQDAWAQIDVQLKRDPMNGDQKVYYWR